MRIALVAPALALALHLAAGLPALAASPIKAGPMPGYAELIESSVWLQTARPAAVQLEYRSAPDPESTRTQVIETTPEDDHIASFIIPGLAPGRRFQYDVFVDGEKVVFEYPLEFVTQPNWRWRTEPPEFKFAFGSCSFINDAAHDRPGRVYGGAYEIYAAMTRAKPDFMVWLGDNYYFRETDWVTEGGMRYRASHTRSLPEMQPFLAVCHHYATWDDHDFGPNDSDRSFRLKDAALRVHADYWPAIQYGTAETRGVFQRFEWADVEFFLLDDRYHRSPNRAPDGPDKVMFGAAQIQWLKDALSSSNAPFKVICSGGQMIQSTVLYEAFAQCPEERKDLFDYIANNDIRGVLFLSGDRHHTELLKIEWPGSPYPWYEFTCSPLNSGTSRIEREVENSQRVPGTYVTGLRNYGVIEVTGPRLDRVMRLACYNSAGTEQWSYELRARDMRKPEEPRPASTRRR